jgi:hypothetical protein
MRINSCPDVRGPRPAAGATLVKPSIVARRLRKSADADHSHNPMETVVCGKCGQRFVIDTASSAPNAELTEKRMAWIEDQLTWDHIQERKHHASMELPDLK